MKTPTSSQIRSTLKRLLKKQNGSYSDLARILNLSVPAVKRFMNRGEISVERLESIVSWFGLSLIEFLQIAQNTTFNTFEFSQDQEAALSKNPQALYILLLIGAGYPSGQLAKASGLSKSSIEQSLLLLDKIGLIEFSTGDKVRVLARGPFKMLKTGPLRQRVYPNFLKQLAGLISELPAPETLQLPFELYVSDEMYEAMKHDLQGLLQKYSRASRVNHELNETSLPRPASGMLLLTRVDSWKQVLIQSASLGKAD